MAEWSNARDLNGCLTILRLSRSFGSAGSNPAAVDFHRCFCTIFCLELWTVMPIRSVFLFFIKFQVLKWELIFP